MKLSNLISLSENFYFKFISDPSCPDHTNSLGSGQIRLRIRIHNNGSKNWGKKFACKGTLRQVFFRVFRLETQSVMLICLTQLSDFPPPLSLPCVNKYTVYTNTVCKGEGVPGVLGPRKIYRQIYLVNFFRWRYFACLLWVFIFYASILWNLKFYQFVREVLFQINFGSGAAWIPNDFFRLRFLTV